MVNNCITGRHAAFLCNADPKWTKRIGDRCRVNAAELCAIPQRSSILYKSFSFIYFFFFLSNLSSNIIPSLLLFVSNGENRDSVLRKVREI